MAIYYLRDHNHKDHPSLAVRDNPNGIAAGAALLFVVAVLAVALLVETIATWITSLVNSIQ